MGMHRGCLFFSYATYNKLVSIYFGLQYAERKKNMV